MQTNESSTANIGLTTKEAEKKIQQYGKNVVNEKQLSPVMLLLRKFWGVIPWMLEIAIIIDLILGRWVEGSMIGGLLVANVLMGFAQEKRAKEALRLLRQKLSVNVRVRRDGRWQILPAANIVPNDQVYLRVGDIVPADIRIIKGTLSVDQSQLTGESLPVESHDESIIYAGSIIRRGEATGVVTATGTHTYYGKTAELVRLADAPRRLELLVVKVASYLGSVVIILAVTALVVMIIRGTPLSQMLPFGMMLLVTSVPVALPMMFTMTAALGARMLADKGILVTRLSAIEDAASMDVLCLDKTGTLTENQLAVTKVKSFTSKSSDEIIRLATIASDEATQDPIDLAFIQAANGLKLLINLSQRLSFNPFDPTSKRSEASIRDNGQIVHIVKGEPSILAELTHTPWEKIKADIVELSSDGSRVLAVASGKDSEFTLVGLVALSDTPRTDSAALITNLKNRGIRVVLITGDGEATGRAIAAKVGITGAVAPHGIIGKNMNPEDLLRFNIFTQVFPQDKFSLVQALQQAGHIVGMTGDGVNDAPALRQADVGIAVASATDVAKAAASLVLTRPGISEIVMAIDGSRKIFQRMKNFVLTMVSMKLSTPIFFALGVILFSAFVLTPLQIVILMLLGNFVTMSVSMDQVTPSPKPDKWKIRPLMTAGGGLAILSISLNGAVFWVAMNILRLGVAQTQTLVFFWLVIGSGQALLYITRGRGYFWEKPYPGRMHLMITLIEVGLIILFATQGWLMAAIPLWLVGSLLMLVFVFLIVADTLKITLTRLTERTVESLNQGQMKV